MMENQLKDVLVRGTAWNGKIRVFAARTTQLVEELRKRHGTFPTATAALGRTLTAGAIMGAMLKGQEKLTIQVKGDGPIGQIVVDANADGEVRGYVDHPQVHLASNAHGKLDVAGAVGRSGHLHITKDLRDEGALPRQHSDYFGRARRGFYLLFRGFGADAFSCRSWRT